ncbi:MAG: UDP-N-acetylmuramoyl-L-alanyl-D-glutamate--2,6-diaminopimelate ligase [Proteobacteria bacterium]|nr:UDP-N-acetylmuramoyl-L-alanyl-D-glutamate--2,6-diaminopimelate ligase [Pseudomonadota bacterium]
MKIAEYRFFKEAKGITNNSNHVKKDYVFCAYPGKKFDGAEFIKDAIEKGAKFILIEAAKEIKLLQKNYPKINIIRFKNIASNQKKILDSFYGNLNQNIKLIGITGTNGKTSTGFWLDFLINKHIQPSKLIGTISKEKNIQNTTPDLFVLYDLFHKNINKIKNFVLEVSSHGIDQQRIKGLNFEYGIFTNLSRDHLDYHKTMTNYFSVKERFFLENVKNCSIINIDDKYGARLYQNLKTLNKKVLTFGYSKHADIKIIHSSASSMSKSETEFELEIKNKRYQFESNIIGNFNILNLVGALAVCHLKKISMSALIKTVKKLPIPEGRLEMFNKKINNTNKKIFIDYAHSPDGLKNVLETIKSKYKKKLTLVFGCGGDRDLGKRKLMGQVSNQYADYVFITSDNPRSEDPMKIAQQISNHVTINKKIVINRKKAIEEALKQRSNEVILIAGKGHENHQILKDKTIFFSDKEVVKSFKG